MQARKTLKRTGTILILCTLIALLTGCAVQSEEPSESPRSVAEEPKPAVQELTAVSAENAPVVKLCEDGRTLVSWNGKDSTELVLLDEEDTVIKRRSFSSILILQQGSFSDGSFLLADWENGAFRFLTEDLEDLFSFATKDLSGVFNSDHSCYYRLIDQVLCKINVETGEQQRVSLSEELRFSEILDYEPQENIMALACLISPYSTRCGTAIVELDSGELSLLTEESYRVVLTKEKTAFRQFDNDSCQYSVLFENGGWYTAPAGQFSGEWMEIHAADWVLTMEKGTLTHLGKTLFSCALQDCGVAGEVRNGWCSDGEETLLVSTYGGGKNRLYRVNLSALTLSECGSCQQAQSPFAVSDSMCDTYWGMLTHDKVPDSLQEVREYANAIEKKYEVTVLVSDQCQEAAKLSPREIEVTAADSFESEPETIFGALEGLDRALSLFPDGFCSQFRNSMGEGGLRFLLVLSIDGGHSTVGLTYVTGSWNNIAFDVVNYDTESIVCHEMWHAIENHICDSEPFAFDASVWCQNDPEGFQYFYDTAYDAIEGNKWTLTDGEDNGLYFTDSYAKTNEMEDRARIFEYLMTREELVGELTASPPIQGKMTIMFTKLRNAFDTAGWETPKWEFNWNLNEN